MRKQSYIDQLNEERVNKLDKEIKTLKMDLKKAHTAYNKAVKDEEKKLNDIKYDEDSVEYLTKKINIEHNINQKLKRMIYIDNKLIELKIKKKTLVGKKDPEHTKKVEQLTNDLINHLGGNYKEKTIPTPYESGRKELSTKHKDNISNLWEKHNDNDEITEYTPPSAIEGAFGNSASDAEQDIYDTIDYNLGNTQEISPALLEALKYYEEHEEPTIKDKKSRPNKMNLYEDYDEDFYKQREYEKLTEKRKTNKKLEEKYDYLNDKFFNQPKRKNKKDKEREGDYYGGRKQAKMGRNTNHRNAKSKTRYKRIHKTQRHNRKKDMEKYGFTA